jgi:integrase
MANEKRRANGEGTIRQRSDGRWEGKLSLPGGKRKSVYGATKKDAREALNAARKKLDEGIDVGARTQTIETFLESWLAGAKERVRPKTHRTYQDLLRLHVIPELGKVRLDRLTAPQIAALLRDKHAAGLSPKTVSHIRATLRAALNEAVRWRLIAYNPATAVAAPRVPYAPVDVLTPDEARRVLATASGHRHEAL